MTLSPPTQYLRTLFFGTEKFKAAGKILPLIFDTKKDYFCWQNEEVLKNGKKILPQLELLENF